MHAGRIQAPASFVVAGVADVNHQIIALKHDLLGDGEKRFTDENGVIQVGATLVLGAERSDVVECGAPVELIQPAHRVMGVRRFRRRTDHITQGQGSAVSFRQIHNLVNRIRVAALQVGKYFLKLFHQAGSVAIQLFRYS